MNIDVEDLQSTVTFALIAAGVRQFLWKDVEQEVWLEVVKAAKRFDASRGVSFRAFVRHRAKGAAIDARRKSDFLSRDHRGQVEAGECENVVHVPLEDAQAHQSLQKNPELAAIESVLVNDALAVLSARRRYLVEQIFFKERVDSDIAREMGITTGRVSQLKSAAIREMRTHLCRPASA